MKGTRQLGLRPHHHGDALLDGLLLAVDAIEVQLGDVIGLPVGPLYDPGDVIAVEMEEAEILKMFQTNRVALCLFFFFFFLLTSWRLAIPVPLASRPDLP